MRPIRIPGRCDPKSAKQAAGVVGFLIIDRTKEHKEDEYTYISSVCDDMSHGYPRGVRGEIQQTSHDHLCPVKNNLFPHQLLRVGLLLSCGPFAKRM